MVFQLSPYSTFITQLFLECLQGIEYSMLRGKNAAYILVEKTNDQITTYKNKSIQCVKC